jgi:hypothetical protein
MRPGADGKTEYDYGSEKPPQYPGILEKFRHEETAP